jgi:hypothetical protein
MQVTNYVHTTPGFGTNAEDSCLDFLLPTEFVETGAVEQDFETRFNNLKITPTEWKDTDQTNPEQFHKIISEQLSRDRHVAVQSICTLSQNKELRSVLATPDIMKALMVALDEEQESMWPQIVESLRLLCSHAPNRKLFTTTFITKILSTISQQDTNTEQGLSMISNCCGLLYTIGFGDIGTLLNRILSSNSFNSKLFTQTLFTYQTKKADLFVSYIILAIIIRGVIDYVERADPDQMPKWFLVVLGQMYQTDCFSAITQQALDTRNVGVQRDILFKILNNVVFGSPLQAIATNFVQAMQNHFTDVELQLPCILAVDELLQRAASFPQGTMESMIQRSIVSDESIQLVSRVDDLQLANAAMKLIMRFLSNQVILSQLHTIRPKFPTLIDNCAAVLTHVSGEAMSAINLSCIRQSTCMIAILLQMSTESANAERMIYKGVLDSVIYLAPILPKLYIDNILLAVAMLFRSAPQVAILRMDRSKKSKEDMEKFIEFLKPFVVQRDDELLDNPFAALKAINDALQFVMQKREKKSKKKGKKGGEPQNE